jgi:hypothetical protein
MAARLPLHSGSLPFIWNVSSRVGPSTDEPNNPTDVELLKVLLVMAMSTPQIAKFGLKGNSLQPSRDGVFDPILGFWIFRMQQLGRHPGGDGVASPARGAAFAPGSPWVIFSFNEFARQSDPELWEKLPNNISLSGALRAELSR